MTVNVFRHGRHHIMESMKVEWEQGVIAITPEDGHAKRGFLMSNGYMVSWYGDQTEAAKLPPFCIPPHNDDVPSNTEPEEVINEITPDDTMITMISEKFKKTIPDIEGMVNHAVLEALKTAFGKLAE